MKLWKYSLWLSIISCALLLVVVILPKPFTVFIWTKSQVEAGVLFPVLLISWTTALFGFAINNVFLDKSLTDTKIRMKHYMRILPSMLGFPAFISFIWFIYRWYKGEPTR